MIGATTAVTAATTIVIDISRMTLGGRQSRNRPTNNTIKTAAKHNYEDAYSKVLQGPYPAHLDFSHTMGNCRGLKSIYHSDAHKRQRSGDKNGDKDDRQDDIRPDEEDKTEEEHDKDPRHAYKDPDRSVRSIFGGKVALENGRQRKLTTQAIMALNNSDKRVADPKYQKWSHHPITFNRADQWTNILEPGRFPLVLDPVIRNVRVEKVLIDGGSALDILLHNALTELGIKPEDLEPYDAPF
jgi:hypothetical protein